MARHTFFCIDAHTAGNPVRVVASRGPRLEGGAMSDRRQHFLREYDWIRKGLMFEPRGHDMMSGSFIYEPSREDCDAAVLFIETSGCLPMCGHGVIGTVTVLVEHGLVYPETPGLLRLETPAGRVDARYEWQDGRVVSVEFVNVPSFLAAEKLEVECPELGALTLDVCYGGNFYAIIEPQSCYTDLSDYNISDLLRWSPVLRRRLNERHSFVHPEDDTIRGLSHIEWTGRPLDEEAHARNAVFYGDRAIDRSPCGTGTSARMAQLASRGELIDGEEFVHESIIGSLFRGRIVDRVRVGDREAIVPSIRGRAHVTGFNTIVLDTDEPYLEGFQVL